MKREIKNILIKRNIMVAEGEVMEDDDGEYYFYIKHYKPKMPVRVGIVGLESNYCDLVILVDDDVTSEALELIEKNNN